MNDARKKFSDESLNAFIDNQLGAQEREEILAAIAEDADLSRRLGALRSTKELVRHAYGQVSAAGSTRDHRLPLWSGALAAGVAEYMSLRVEATTRAVKVEALKPCSACRM